MNENAAFYSCLLRFNFRQFLHHLLRFQTHGDDLADEADDVFLVIHPVRIAGEIALVVTVSLETQKVVKELPEIKSE